MTSTMRRLAFACSAAGALMAAPAGAQGFDWKHFSGETLNVLLNNHPWSNAIRDLAPEFTAKTGIKLRVERWKAQRIDEIVKDIIHGVQAA